MQHIDSLLSCGVVSVFKEKFFDDSARFHFVFTD